MSREKGRGRGICCFGTGRSRREVEEKERQDGREGKETEVEKEGRKENGQASQRFGQMARAGQGRRWQWIHTEGTPVVRGEAFKKKTSRDYKKKQI